VTTYTVEWVQVAGTNYHWQGALKCRVAGGVGTSDGDNAKAQTQITGWSTGSTTVKVGDAPSSDTVNVTGNGLQVLELQQQTDDGWRWIKTVKLNSSGTGQVTFPKMTEKGTLNYRLQVQASDEVTGATTGSFTVKAK
jgi:hypothetical protein